MTVPLYNLTDTWNVGGTVFTAIQMNVTDTASNASSKLLDLQIAGVSKFTVQKVGDISLTGAAFIGTGIVFTATSSITTHAAGATLSVDAGAGTGTIFAAVPGGSGNDNCVIVISAVTGSPCVVRASGGAADVPIEISGQGLGSVLVNGGAVATTATDGFLYIPTCAGAPVGTPTTFTGRVPMVFDTTNSQFWFFTGGAWKQPKTPAGAAIVTWQ